MKILPHREDFFWMLAGAAILFLVGFAVFQVQKSSNPAAQLAAKTEKMGLVDQMLLSLALASEAEKSAVLSGNEADSQAFVDQARKATAEVEHASRGLAKQLLAGGSDAEKDYLTQFSQAFTEFQHIDQELLALAVKNTTSKAYNLAYGSAATAVKEMGGSLSHLATAYGGKTDSDQITSPALKAVIAVLNIEVLLPHHIAEESDPKMDALESLMRAENQEVEHDLASLAAEPRLHKNADLDAAVAGYHRFTEIKTQILALSRENTNVRSLSMSLHQKRKITLVCHALLNNLKEAVAHEPVAGQTLIPVVNPR